MPNLLEVIYYRDTKELVETRAYSQQNPAGYILTL